MSILLSRPRFTVLFATLSDQKTDLKCLPPPPKVKEVMFSPVCLFVCVQDISKGYGWIQMKFCGQVGCVTRTNRLDFGEDLDPATRIL